MAIEVTQEYLRRFPISMQECLANEEQRQFFCKTVFDKYHPIRVYRLIHSANQIDEYDFLDNVREFELRDKAKRRCRNRGKIQFHAVSVNEDKKELEKSLDLPNKDWHAIAEGKLDCQHGPADFEESKTHHNWYLYDGENKKVCEKFKIL